MRYEARSEYVQERIRHTTWKERGEIAKLLSIERYALDGHIHGFAHGSMISALRSSRPDEFKTILAELNPELLEYWTQEEQRKNEALSERFEQRASEDVAEYRDWLAAGGRP